MVFLYKRFYGFFIASPMAIKQKSEFAFVISSIYIIFEKSVTLNLFKIHEKNTAVSFMRPARCGLRQI